jgi:hypothetical protein
MDASIRSGWDEWWADGPSVTADFGTERDQPEPHQRPGSADR